MKKLIIAALVAIAVIVANGGRTSEAGSLPTGTMYLTLDQWGPHAPSGTKIQLYGNVNGSNQGYNPVPDGSADVTQGGAFEWKIDAGSSYGSSEFYNPLPITSANQLMTFCIEINQNIWWNNNPAFSYKLIPLDQAPQPATPNAISGSGMGTQAATLIKELWAQEFQKVFDSSLTSTQRNINAGAFQLAIWKIEYDVSDTSLQKDGNGNITGVDVSKGYLEVTSGLSSAVVSQAQTWLKLLSLDPTSTAYKKQADLVALSSGASNGNQDQVVQYVPPPSQFASPVPEPGSGLIWLAVGGIVGCWRRMRTSA